MELAPITLAKIALMLVVYFVGTLGNLLVIFMIIYLGETKKITHWYVLQLAIADLIFLQFLPPDVSEIIQGNMDVPIWMCKIKETIKYMNYYGSIIFLSIMAQDRYLAVCRGLSTVTGKVRSLRTCYIITAAAWLVALIMCIPVMVYGGRGEVGKKCKCLLNFPKDESLWCVNYDFDPENCTSHFATFEKNLECGISGSEENEDDLDLSGFYYYGFNLSDTPSADYSVAELNDNSFDHCLHENWIPGFRTFTYFNFVGMFIVPLIIISICYGLIVMQLRRTDCRLRRNSERNDSSIPSGSEIARSVRGRSQRRKSSSTGHSNNHKLRVIILCGVLVILFVVCWLPFHAFHIAKIVGFFTRQGGCDIGDTVTVLLVYVNSALNPFLYNFLGTFTKRMREIRKHKRTKFLLASLRLTKNGGTYSSTHGSFSETLKTKKTSVGGLQNERSIFPAEEIPLTGIKGTGD